MYVAETPTTRAYPTKHAPEGSSMALTISGTQDTGKVFTLDVRKFTLRIHGEREI